MKIMIIVDKLSLLSKGYGNIIDELLETGHEVICISADSGPNACDAGSHENLKFYFIPHKGRNHITVSIKFIIYCLMVYKVLKPDRILLYLNKHAISAGLMFRFFRETPVFVIADSLKLLKGKKAVFCYFNPADLGKFYIYLPTDPRAAYLTDLGMELPESVKKLAETSDSFALEISSENIDKLADVDIIITYGTDALLEQLQKDNLLGTVPAVKNGAVAILEDGSALAASSTPSALSIPATIDEYLSIIGKAADKVK